MSEERLGPLCRGLELFRICQQRVPRGSTFLFHGFQKRKGRKGQKRRGGRPAYRSFQVHLTVLSHTRKGWHKRGHFYKATVDSITVFFCV